MDLRGRPPILSLHIFFGYRSMVCDVFAFDWVFEMLSAALFVLGELANANNLRSLAVFRWV